MIFPTCAPVVVSPRDILASLRHDVSRFKKALLEQLTKDKSNAVAIAMHENELLRAQRAVADHEQRQLAHRWG